MTHHFTVLADATGVTVQLVGPAGPVDWNDWALEAPDTLEPGVVLAKRLEADDLAQGDDDVCLVDHRAVASLTARQAAALGLPPLAETVAHIATRGVLTRPDFSVELSWQRPGGQPILGAERIGACIRIGGELRRLPGALYELAEAAEPLRTGAGRDEGERLAAVARLQEVLPPAAKEGLAEATGLVGAITIAVAGSFSLDWCGEGPSGRLAPVLHAGGEDQPLLSPEHQAAFADRHFGGFREARSAYTVGRGAFVVVEPTLRRALSVVRAANDGPPSRRRVLLANPRAVLREALGEEADEIVLDRLVRDTPAYSDRVIGLGLWTPRVVPWVTLERTEWFEREPGSGKDDGASQTPKTAGIMVGDRAIPLDANSAAALRSDVEAAIAAGRVAVPYAIDDGEVAIPATSATLDAIAAFEQLAVKGPRRDTPARAPAESLLIATNEGEIGAAEEFAPVRPASTADTPSCLRTTLKPHQQEGLAWLRRAWAGGSPGVLLADDMGLGKTLQGLAFLAWIRDGMELGAIARAPLLIVAPTGLLANWQAEHDAHLTAPGLGICLPAYGRGLAAIKRVDADGRPRLDVSVMRRADWILTTYETLRDHDRDFGEVRFAVALFDEAQKIKSPGVRLTDAAKSMQADLKVALTGTPVENRLADLWCIIDGVHPGWLQDLKNFSAEYERDLNPTKLASLKGQLERGFGGRAPLMLRRLKADRLPDLPPAEERPFRRTMPSLQRDAYMAALAEGRCARDPGAVLGVLQRLRAISLHPDVEGAATDDAFVAASARLQATLDRLDEIALRNERALVFLDDRALQGRLTALLQKRYNLATPPSVINGAVPGPKRQQQVDRFQAAPDGFGVMILSPKAGGVGLTVTRANHVIHLSRWWNPAVEDQCTGRVLRIGQTRPVTVNVPMAVLGGDSQSFDENLDTLLTRKRKLMRDTLMPPEANPASDAAELFRSTIG